MYRDDLRHRGATDVTTFAVAVDTYSMALTRRGIFSSSSMEQWQAWRNVVDLPAFVQAGLVHIVQGVRLW